MQATKRSFISARAPIHIWDFEEHKPYLMFTMELYFKKEQSLRGSEAGEQAVTGLKHGASLSETSV